MIAKHFILASTLIVACVSQRSPYAGLRPIGFPVIETTTLANSLVNRFGETTTTQRLPLEALGDRELVNRLGKLPQDKQPFWLLNWLALEENRKRPQSFPQRPNVFSESVFRELSETLSRNNNNQNTESQNNARLDNRNLQETTTKRSEINTQNQKVLSENTVKDSLSASPESIDKQRVEDQNNAALNRNVQDTTTKQLKINSQNREVLSDSTTEDSL